MKEYGTTHAFFQEVMMRFTAKEAEQLGLKFILAHSEGASGYMADGYARASGKPGFCLAQSIGAANLVGGITDAFLANSPVIAITGKKTPEFQYKNAYQETNHSKLFDAVTKFNAELLDAQQLPFLIRQSYREAVTGKPGPVHLDIPDFIGVSTELSAIKEPLVAETIFGQMPPLRPSADPDLVAKAAQWMQESEKPLIVAGRGVFISDAGDQVLELARRTDTPVVTTPDGKTIMDETDPLWAGIVGAYGMDSANQAAMKADLVIFIGSQTSDQTTNNWISPKPKTRVIQIDIYAGELGRSYPNSVGLLGDAKAVAQQLVAAVPAISRPEWRAKVDGFVKDTLGKQAERMADTATPIRTEFLCKTVSEVLPSDAILVADTGYSAVWSATMIRMKKTQMYLRAAGSLGWSYPASLGAKCAMPNRPVVCFSGDGAFYYHLAEMETAMRYGINTVTIINNNSMLSQCAPSMRVMYYEDPESGMNRLKFGSVSFANLAKEFGLFALRVEQPADLASALEQALSSDVPALIEVITADANTSVPLEPLE